MAHNLKLKVVAEGMETEAQRAHPRCYDCDAVQGYLISRPVAAQGLPQLPSGAAESA